MEDIERIKERLENIQGVEPLISSLRTIAAGGWRMALRHQQASERYVEHLGQILAALFAQARPSRLTHPAIRRESQAFRTALVLVIASERGLCGGYNDTALEGAERLIAQQQLQSEQVFVATLGAQASVHFERAGRELYTSYAMPVTRVPSAELIREIAESLLAPFYQGEMDAIFVIHVPYRLGLTMPPVLQRWVPVEPSMLPGRSTQWPPPILETKAETLFELTMHEWIYSRFYQFVMAASASEQSARYRAMENASSNIQRIISELTLSYHSARQHAITMEMLDLVAASGMLRGPEERLS